MIFLPRFSASLQSMMIRAYEDKQYFIACLNTVADAQRHDNSIAVHVYEADTKWVVHQFEDFRVESESLRTSGHHTKLYTLI